MEQRSQLDDMQIFITLGCIMGFYSIVALCACLLHSHPQLPPKTRGKQILHKSLRAAFIPDSVEMHTIQW